MVFEFIVSASCDGALMEEDVADLLFESGCDDATVSYRGDKVILAFSREAASMQEAVQTAIEAVRKAGLRVEMLSDQA